MKTAKDLLLAYINGSAQQGFKFGHVKSHIDIPDQVLAEYHIRNKSGISGKNIRRQFASPM